MIIMRDILYFKLFLWLLLLLWRIINNHYGIGLFPNIEHNENVRNLNDHYIDLTHDPYFCNLVLIIKLDVFKKVGDKKYQESYINDNMNCPCNILPLVLRRVPCIPQINQLVQYLQPSLYNKYY